MSADGARIRPYRRGEQAAVWAVFQAAVRIGAASWYSEAERQEWAEPAEVPPELDDWLCKQITLVAEEDGRITGYMTLQTDAHLDLAFVLPERMGTGLADRLHAALLERARAAGMTRLTVDASRFAQSFFGRMGWRPAQDPRQDAGENPEHRPMQIDLGEGP